jgi:hypothetical protein
MTVQSFQQLLVTNYGLQPSGYTGSQGFVGSSGGSSGGSGFLVENSQTVSANYTITTGKSAMSAGPITIDTNIIVTVPTGSRWVIV